MWYILVLLVSLVFGGVSVAAEPAVKPETLAQIKKESRIFESIIAEVLRQNFDNPFAVAAAPQAAYIQGYGLIVSYHLKINRGTIRGFYGEVRSPVAPDVRSKREQIETVRRLMVQALGDYGGAIKRLQPTDRLAICAHVEDRNELDPAKNRTDLVISVAKGDIDAYSATKIDTDEFRQRVEVIEY
ncbi:MAG: hypothetical protein JSU96_21195 [Acidobacteriota bacterium]|nr:MAG: hypothetical protein JSU96_21195 [Acidobacteriota bacterium]